MHAALLGALAVDRIDRLARLICGDDLALAGDDPEEHVGAHRRRHHRADEQERGAAGEQLAREPRREDDEQRTTSAPTTRSPFCAGRRRGRSRRRRARRRRRTPSAVDDRRRRRPVVHALVDQEGAGVEQVQHREQREAGEPGRVALPHRPVQVLGQARRRDRVLLLVIEAAAVHRPQLAADALGAISFVVGRRRQAGVEADEVERGADPGDAGDDVGPAQQQVGPVEQVGVHGVSQRRRRTQLPR